MNLLKSIIAFILFFIFINSELISGPKPEDIKAAKQATALVKVKIKRSVTYGAAFCVGSSGIYVTEIGVIRKLLLGDDLLLILRAGEVDQEAVSASIVLIDKSIGIVFLSTNKKGKNVALKLGDSNKVIETSPVVKYGFTHFSSKLEKNRFPNVSVNLSSVNYLGKDKEGSLEKIKLKSSRSTATSGGPVLDMDGQVIGMHVRRYRIGRQPGRDYVLPVNKLIKILEKAIVVESIPVVNFENRFLPTDFNVLITTIARKTTGKFSVFLSVKDKKGKVIKHQLVSTDNKNFKGTFSPLAPPKSNIKMLNVIITYSGGLVVGTTENKKITINGSQEEFLNIAKVELGSNERSLNANKLLLNDGKKIIGKIEGFDSIKVVLNDQNTFTANLKNVGKVEFKHIDESLESLDYSLVVLEESKTVYESKGQIKIKASSPSELRKKWIALDSIVSGNPGVSEDYTPLVVDKKEIKLPGSIDEVAVGGGGRYLIFLIKKLRKLVIFDNSKLKVVKYLPVFSPNLIFAAGGSKLVVIYTDKHIIQTFSLESFKKVVTRTVPVDGIVKGLVMGSSNESSFLLHWAKRSAALSRAHFTFFNVDKMREIKTNKFSARNDNYRDIVHMRASSDGQLYGMWCSSHSSSDMVSLSVSGNIVESHYKNSSYGRIMPSYDGKFILTSSGRFTPNLNLISSDKKISGFLLPTYHPAYYYTLSGDSKNRGLSLYTADVGSALFKMQGLTETVNPSNSWRRNDFSSEMRCHVIPQYNLLVTIPYSNDKVILRKFNIKNLLNKSNLDYLYIISSPPGKVALGEEVKYQIKVESKKGGVKYKLESGPDGMVISNKGMVTWRANKVVAKEPVIITVSDLSGQEIFHTFNLSIK